MDGDDDGDGDPENFHNFLNIYSRKLPNSINDKLHYKSININSLLIVSS